MEENSWEMKGGTLYNALGKQWRWIFNILGQFPIVYAARVGVYGEREGLIISCMLQIPFYQRMLECNLSAKLQRNFSKFVKCCDTQGVRSFSGQTMLAYSLHENKRKMSHESRFYYKVAT